MAKRIKVSRKDLLKEPDQFLSTSEKAMLYFMDNRATVLGGIAIFLIGVSSFFGFKYFKETQTLANEAFYFEIEKIVDNAADGKPTSEVELILGKIGDGFQKERASLLLADLHFQNQDYDKADALYTKVMSTSSAGQVNYQLAQVGLAYNSESNKQYQRAIDLFKTVIDANTDFPLFEVYWSLSRCYELNSDSSNALLILREMQIKFAANPQMEKVELRIKQLSV
ncbi:MAG: tetratricopeptide repeat protein [Nitrospina sp.]|jgi:predicted negative regulator of RcsB-dependent stress response|nr:tetratricopeptide repeat protein [Nitrospina sp.]MBT3877231.1 tetratricopeptide repeat protein [Nitrospina sp.]MBT4046898.1 tetratricopeptide repeat protein [Nitrospina sp.]MBT4557380.1 tetratricopeptide repeat protein [Nitrospina sp.]MBT5350021.1 tetratricopeptide repeat protein [Nitrospina sp.]